MTLYELGLEYEERYRELLRRVEQLRKGLKEADSNKVVELRRRICSLYADLEKCREIGAKLRKYYDYI